MKQSYFFVLKEFDLNFGVLLCHRGTQELLKAINQYSPLVVTSDHQRTLPAVHQAFLSTVGFRALDSCRFIEVSWISVKTSRVNLCRGLDQLNTFANSSAFYSRCFRPIRMLISLWYKSAQSLLKQKLGNPLCGGSDHRKGTNINSAVSSWGTAHFEASLFKCSELLF
jgi:hypothetical protein